MSDRYRNTHQTDLSVYQSRLRFETRNLLRLLDELVPHTTIHYAVEDARRVLRVLDAKMDGVRTADIAQREAKP